MAITAENVGNGWDVTANVAKMIRFGLLGTTVLSHWKVVNVGGHAINLARIQDVAAQAHFGLLALHSVVTLSKNYGKKTEQTQLSQWRDVGLLTADFAVLAIFLQEKVKPFLSKTMFQDVEHLLWLGFVGGATAGLVNEVTNPNSKTPKMQKAVFLSLLAYALAELTNRVKGADYSFGIFGKEIPFWKVRTLAGVTSGGVGLTAVSYKLWTQRKKK